MVRREGRVEGEIRRERGAYFMKYEQGKWGRVRVGKGGRDEMMFYQCMKKKPPEPNMETQRIMRIIRPEQKSIFIAIILKYSSNLFCYIKMYPKGNS